MKREESFSHLETEESTWTEEQRSKERDPRSGAELRDSKKYILVAILVNIIFFIVLGLEVKSSKDESTKYQAQIKELSAQLKAKTKIEQSNKINLLNLTPVQALTSTITSPSQTEKQLSSDIKVMKETLKKVSKDLQENVKQVRQLNAQIQQKEERINELTVQIEKKSIVEIDLNNKIKRQALETQKMKDISKEVGQLQEEMQKLKQKEKEYQQTIKNQQKQIATPLNKVPSLYNDRMQQLKKKAVKERINFSKNNFEKNKGMELLPYNSQLSQNTPIEENIFYPTHILMELQVTEVPFCVIIPSYIDVPLYHIQFSLNSIFRQFYKNYIAVIFSSPLEEVNDFILNYLQINNIPKSKYAFIRTPTQKPSLENIYAGVNYFCQEGSMAMVVEGGHELLGKYVFKVYNTFHLQFQYGVIYSNYFIMQENKSIGYGGTLHLSDEEKTKNLYRKTKRSRFQLFAFKVELFRKIHFTDLQDEKGNFFDVPITAIAVPLLELSCGRAVKITGVYFVMQLTDATRKDLAKQSAVAELIAGHATKACDLSFNLTMMEKEKKRYPKELEDISDNKFKQKPGMIDTPNGTVSLIDIYGINKDGKRISDVLYTSRQKIARDMYHQSRIDYIKDKENFESLHLIKYSLKSNASLDQQQAIDEANQYARLDAKYNFDSYKQQLPFCIIIPSLNNNIHSRIEYNLNTIFTQNYSNYFVVLINDASTDGSDFTYRSYFHFYNISKEKYAYIENQNRKTALENIHDATYNFCSDDSVTMIVDGDDELIGKNVFKVFNAAHQKLKGGVIYSSYYFYSQGKKIQIGISQDYTQQEKVQVSFRKAQIKYCQLRTHKTALFKALNKTIYQDEKGQFYKVTYDFSTYIPMMELACGRAYYIGGYYYLYNGATGNNDGYINYRGQIDVVYKVRAKPKLQCLPEYKNLTLFT